MGFVGRLGWSGGFRTGSSQTVCIGLFVDITSQSSALRLPRLRTLPPKSRSHDGFSCPETQFRESVAEYANGDMLYPVHSFPDQCQDRPLLPCGRCSHNQSRTESSRDTTDAFDDHANLEATCGRSSNPTANLVPQCQTHVSQRPDEGPI